MKLVSPSKFPCIPLPLAKCIDEGYHRGMESMNTPSRLPVLSEDLLGSIIFSMEDQANFYFLDLAEALVVREDELEFLEKEGISQDEHDQRFLPLPDWQPSDGFRLMELFANRVRNPLYRQRLLDALQSGKGVFRKFKDTIAENPVLERKWFSFKDEQLKREVIRWYREQEGVIELEQLPLEHEDLTEDILLEDFTFETYEGKATKEIQDLMDFLFTQLEQGTEESKVAAMLLSRRLETEELQHFHLARTQDGTLAAFLAYLPLSESLVEVPYFGVNNEYRGMGLFRLLFDSFCRHMARSHYPRIIITLAGDYLGLQRLFMPYGAQPMGSQLLMATRTWNASHPSSEQAFL